jgi:glycerophosphoryl diester phosphodiesterase
MNTIKIDKDFTGMIAHRGLSGIETENTEAAFIAAANRTYAGIECDVRVSKDDQLIVTHDDTLLRLGLLNIHIPSFTYAEIRRFSLVDRKTGGLSESCRIPLLKDVLQICAAYGKTACIDIKDGLSKHHLDTIIVNIEKYHHPDKTCIVSEDRNELSYIRQHYPMIELFLGCENPSENDVLFCEKESLNLYAQAKHLTDETIKRFHLKGLKVGVYTINDKRRAERFIKMGIDYLTTDILE